MRKEDSLILYSKLSSICERIVSDLMKKNEDYDDAFGKLFRKYGEIVFVVHLEEKVNRFLSLLNKDPNFEKKEDTIKDIIGYCLLYLNLMKEKEDEK